MSRPARTPTTSSLPTIADCGGCGVCCLHMGYPEYVRPTTESSHGESSMDSSSGVPEPESHWVEMPEPLRRELLDYIARYERPTSGLDGPCFWFDPLRRRCKHHEHRPRVCREFDVGGPGCLEWRKAYPHRILPPADAQ